MRKTLKTITLCALLALCGAFAGIGIYRQYQPDPNAPKQVLVKDKIAQCDSAQNFWKAQIKTISALPSMTHQDSARLNDANVQLIYVSGIRACYENLAESSVMVKQ